MNKEIEISPRQIAKAITDLLNEKEQLEQENTILKQNAEHNDKVVDWYRWKDIQLRTWLKDQLQEYKETDDERGVVLTMYVIDKLNELKGGKND